MTAHARLFHVHMLRPLSPFQTIIIKKDSWRSPSSYDGNTIRVAQKDRASSSIFVQILRSYNQCYK